MPCEGTREGNFAARNVLQPALPQGRGGRGRLRKGMQGLIMHGSSGKGLGLEEEEETAGKEKRRVGEERGGDRGGKERKRKR